MNSEKIIFSQERRFGEKINATFKFLQQNFKKLTKCIIYIAGPFIIVQTILYTLMQYHLMNITVAGTTSFSLLGGEAIFFMLFFILSISIISLVVFEYVNLYTDSSVEEFDVSDVFKLVKKDFFRVILGAIGSYLIIMLGMILLIIPGIYVSVALSLLFIVMIKEKASFSNAVSRCFYLIKGKWWSTFGLLFIMGMIQSMILYAFSLPITILTAVIGSMTMNMEQGATIFTTVWSAVYMLMSTFTYALPIIAVCFQYFNLVEMKESKGLMERIESIGTDTSVRNEETY